MSRLVEDTQKAHRTHTDVPTPHYNRVVVDIPLEGVLRSALQVLVHRNKLEGPVDHKLGEVVPDSSYRWVLVGEQKVVCDGDQGQNY